MPVARMERSAIRERHRRRNAAARKKEHQEAAAAEGPKGRRSETTAEREAAGMAEALREGRAQHEQGRALSNDVGHRDRDHRHVPSCACHPFAHPT